MLVYWRNQRQQNDLSSLTQQRISSSKFEGKVHNIEVKNKVFCVNLKKITL